MFVDVHSKVRQTAAGIMLVFILGMVSGCGSRSGLLQPEVQAMDAANAVDAVDVVDAVDALAVVDAADALDVVDAVVIVDAPPAPDVEVCGPLPPAESCAALHSRCPQLPTGAYPLQTDGTSWEAYCEMSADGGGWTLLLKMNGSAQTFAFGSPLWTNTDTLRTDSTDMTQTEAKFDGFSVLPITALRLGLAPIGGTAPGFLFVGASAASLRGVLALNMLTPTTAGSVAWLALVPGSDLQANCNREGLDSVGMTANQVHVRIGIIANQENDCNTPDSFVGFGAADFRTTTTAGAFCFEEWTCVHGAQVDLPRFGYVFAR